MDEVWQQVRALFAAQLGLAERNQLLALGVTRRMIEHRLRSGEWVLVQPRVYRSALAPCSIEQRQLAACLSAGFGAVVSHRAAVAAWQLDRFEADVVEISVVRGVTPGLQGVVVHRSGDLRPEHLRWVGPVPVTSPARTLVDLGAVSRPWLVERALEHWLRDRKVSAAEVLGMLKEVARKGRSGAGVLRALLDSRALGLEASDSPAEVELAGVLRAYGVPQPAYHHLLRVGVDVFELDFAYPEARLAIEVDGYGPHSSPTAFEEDRRRRNIVEGEDWRVLAYTPNRIRNRPWAVAAEVKRNLEARLRAA